MLQASDGNLRKKNSVPECPSNCHDGNERKSQGSYAASCSLSGDEAFWVCERLGKNMLRQQKSKSHQHALRIIELVQMCLKRGQATPMRGTLSAGCATASLSHLVTHCDTQSHNSTTPPPSRKQPTTPLAHALEWVIAFVDMLCNITKAPNCTGKHANLRSHQ
jgi:hypothetical protein